MDTEARLNLNVKRSKKRKCLNWVVIKFWTTSDIPDGKHATVSIEDDGEVHVEACDNTIKWRLAAVLPSNKAENSQRVQRAFTHLLEQENKKLDQEYKPIAGHRHEAAVEFDSYRIPTCVFTDQIQRIDIPNRSNIGLAIRKNPIWTTIRRAENPQKTDTGATQCQSDEISTIRQKLQRDVQQYSQTLEYKTNEATTINHRREELRIKLGAWQSENTTDNGINPEDQAPYKTAVERVLNAFETNAKRLDLSDLSLKSLPPLYGLFKLESLNLNSNQLELVPVLLKDAPVLLKDAPVLLKDVPVLPSLTEITWGDDATATLALPATFEAHAPKLYALNKLDKWLSEQQYDDQASLKKLQTAVDRIKQAIINNTEDLDLSDLGLETLPPLAGLSSVRTINLSGNSLTEVESLPVLPSVKEVDLSNNVLMYLPTDLAVRFPQAVRLNLSDNFLTVIPAATKMPKGEPPEPFELQLLSGNFLTRATVRAHCDSEFFPMVFTPGQLDFDFRNVFYNDSTVFVNSKTAYDKLTLKLSTFRYENNPKLKHAFEQWPSAKKVIEQRASYADRYNTNHEETLSGLVPDTYWHDKEKFSDAVAYFFCLANEEIPPELFEQLMKPFSDGDRCQVTDQTIAALLLDFQKYTNINGFRSSTRGNKSLITRKEVAHRIVTLLKEAAKNEGTRRNLILTAGDASSTCEDRAALSLFEREQVMLVNKIIAEYSSAVSAPEKQYQQQRLLSMFKEIALIQAAGPFALKEGKLNVGERLDEIEAVLSFYVALRKLKYLSFGPNDMKYLSRSMGVFSLQEVQAHIPKLLEKIARKGVYEIAAQVPEWEAFMVKHDSECKERCDAAKTTRYEAMYALTNDDHPVEVKKFRLLFSAQRGRQEMDDDAIYKAIDNEYNAAKSKVLAERSRVFLSETKPLPRALSSPQFGPLQVLPSN